MGSPPMMPVPLLWLRDLLRVELRLHRDAGGAAFEPDDRELVHRILLAVLDADSRSEHESPTPDTRDPG
jgi:hypothetical protein